MKRIQLTKDQYAIVDDTDFNFLNQFKWCLHSKGYACRNSYERGRSRPKLRYMHREILGLDNSRSLIDVVDHINRNRLDNRKLNLRVVSRKENLLNR